jgi:hypothetical protein
MQKLFTLILFFCFAGAAYAQGFVGANKRQVKRTLAKYSKSAHITPVINENESSYEFLIRDSNYRPADFVYLFDKNNKCIEETRVACDSCVQKYMNEAIAKKQYAWVQVTPNLYLSKYNRHLLMEWIPAAERSRLIIKKIHWTRGAYMKYLNKGTPSNDRIVGGSTCYSQLPIAMPMN